MKKISEIFIYRSIFEKKWGVRVVPFVAFNSLAAVFEAVGFSLFFPIIIGFLFNVSDPLSDINFFKDTFLHSFFERVDPIFSAIFISCLLFLSISIKSSLLFLGQIFLLKESVKLRRTLKADAFLRIINSNGFLFHDKPLSDITSLLTDQIERAMSCFNAYTAFMARTFIAVSYGLFVLYISPTFGVIAALFSILVLTLLRFVNRYIRERSSRVTHFLRIYVNEITNSLFAIKYLSFTGQKAIAEKRVIESVESIVRNDFEMARAHAALALAKEPVALILLMLIIFSVKFLSGDNVSIILVAAYLFYRCVGNAFEVQIFYQKYLETRKSVEFVHQKIESFSNNSNETKERIEFVSAPSVAVHGLSVKFNERGVFSAIDVQIESGKCLLLSGASGSGKSTLVAAMFGQIEFNHGYITYDDQRFDNACELATKAPVVGYVSQKPVCFSSTVLFNITMTYNTISECPPEVMKKVVSVCKRVRLYDVIVSRDKGFETIIDITGDNFSGGQIQRLNLAREMLSPKRVIVFDEPTSGLDRMTENIIIQTIKTLKGYSTVIVISHSDRFKKIADKIYEMPQSIT